MILTDSHLYPVFYLRYTCCPKTWQRRLIQVTRPDLKKTATFSRQSQREDIFVDNLTILAQDQCPCVVFGDKTKGFHVFFTEVWHFSLQKIRAEP